MINLLKAQRFPLPSILVFTRFERLGLCFVGSPLLLSWVIFLPSAVFYNFLFEPLGFPSLDGRSLGPTLHFISFQSETALWHKPFSCKPSLHLIFLLLFFRLGFPEYLSRFPLVRSHPLPRVRVVFPEVSPRSPPPHSTGTLVYFAVSTHTGGEQDPVVNRFPDFFLFQYVCPGCFVSH